jgi:hypothetical protein
MRLPRLTPHGWVVVLSCGFALGLLGSLFTIATVWAMR